MRLTRYLKPAQIRLELLTRPSTKIPEGWSRERIIWSVKEPILLELVELLNQSGKIVKPARLYTDLLNREKKATTGIGGGLAIPHVRTMQARDFALAFARSTPGVEFGALDGRPVHFFFAVVAPPYNDRFYLEVYKQIGHIFGAEEPRRTLMEARTEHEVIKVVSSFSG